MKLSILGIVSDELQRPALVSEVHPIFGYGSNPKRPGGPRTFSL